MTHDKDGLRVLDNAAPDGSGSVNRWSAVSGAEPEDARTLRNTMTSEYQFEMAKRASTAGELEKDIVEGGESVSKEDDVAVEEVVEPAPLPSTSAGMDDFPDGGWRAWLIVVGGVCNTMATFGYVNAWGSFQGYYEEHTLAGTSPSTIAWIGSLQYSLTFLPCLITGRLFDIGYYKGPLLAASVVLVVATFLIAECTQYWHFLLCQGFAIGLASGVIFGPTVSVISHWFRKRRSEAMGIAAVGSSIGGTIFPIVFRNLVGQVGFKWTMRIIAFILMAIIAVPNLTMRRRLPPVKTPGGLVNLKPFAQPALFLFTLAGFLCFLGLYTVLTYIDPSAVYKGLSPDFSFYLVAIANAASALGRIGSGLMADRVGALTMMAPMTAMAGALTFAWPHISTKGGFVAIAIFYGMGSGTFVSLCPVPAIALGPMNDIGRRTGMLMTILALGALAGPPISGAINDAGGNFVNVGIYAGSCVMAAVLIMLYARYLVLGGWKGKF